MKKRYIIIGLTIVLVICSIFLLKQKSGPKYITKVIEKGTITQYVEASGTIKPINTIEVGTQVSGTVAKIYVDYNSTVKKGQLLAELDPSLFEANVDQSKAKLRNANAAYSKANSTLAYKKNNYQRYKHLYEKNYVSKDDVELAQANYLQAKAEVDSAKAEVSAAKASLDNNLTNLRYSKITSPVDGVVISRAVDVGQTVAASFNTPTLFEVAQDLTKMQIETSVSEADIGKIKVGQSAKYSLDGYQDRVFEGKVSQVRLASTTTNNVVTYSVIISVDNEEGLIIPGMSANVSIIVGSAQDVLCVDNKAFKFSPSNNNKKYETQGIWILDKQEPKRVEVELGLSDDNKTQVISRELQVNDKVIIQDLNKNKKNKQTSMRRPPI